MGDLGGVWVRLYPVARRQSYGVASETGGGIHLVGKAVSLGYQDATLIHCAHHLEKVEDSRVVGMHAEDLVTVEERKFLSNSVWQ